RGQGELVRTVGSPLHRGHGAIEGLERRAQPLRAAAHCQDEEGDDDERESRTHHGRQGTITGKPRAVSPGNRPEAEPFPRSPGSVPGRSEREGGEGRVAGTAPPEFAPVQDDLPHDEASEIEGGEEGLGIDQGAAPPRIARARQGEVGMVGTVLAVADRAQLANDGGLQARQRLPALDAQPEDPGSRASAEDARAPHSDRERSPSRGGRGEGGADLVEGLAREVAEEGEREVQRFGAAPPLVGRHGADAFQRPPESRPDPGGRLDGHEEPEPVRHAGPYFFPLRAAVRVPATFGFRFLATHPSFTIWAGRESARAPAGTSETTVVPAPT